MSTFGLAFHHYGLATSKPRQASDFYREIGYTISEPLFDPLQNINLIMCVSANMPTVEIISPGQGECPIDRILFSYGAGMYHACYVCEDFTSFEARLEELGLRVVTLLEPTPAVLFDNKCVSFHVISGLGVIELVHSKLNEFAKI